MFWLSACQQSKEELAEPVTATGIADAKADKDKTGQYVDKSVQVTGYEDGRERPTRPKYDTNENDITTNSLPEEPPCGYEPYDPCPHTSTSPTFVSSVGLGAFSGNSNGYIYALRIAIGSSASVPASTGHIKLNADLNEGAGGKHIYLTFARNPQYSYEDIDGDGRPAKTYTLAEPITTIEVDQYTQACQTFSGWFFRLVL